MAANGRPTVMTPQVKEAILKAVRAGNFREVAAKFAGISYATLKNYCRRKDDPEAMEFLATLQAVEAGVEIELVGAVQTLAACGDLKAATWYLARKFPNRWADKSEDVKEALKILREMQGAKPRRDTAEGSEKGKEEPPAISG